jgi:hypothetical protein
MMVREEGKWGFLRPQVTSGLTTGRRAPFMPIPCQNASTPLCTQHEGDHLQTWVKQGPGRRSQSETRRSSRIIFSRGDLLEVDSDQGAKPEHEPREGASSWSHEGHLGMTLTGDDPQLDCREWPLQFSS